MENEINLWKDKINSLSDTLLSDEDEKTKREKLESTLSNEQMRQLNTIISDPDKIKAVLATPRAKKLMEILSGKKE